MLRKIERPDLASFDRKDFIAKWEKLDPSDIEARVKAMNEPNYLSWEKVKHISPIISLTPTETWQALKMYRRFLGTSTVIRTPDYRNFTLLRRSCDDETLHEIDMCLGEKAGPSAMSLQERRKSLIRRGLIEESISSSQIEGAVTTRAEGKKLLQENRAPRNRSELMIVNNYRMMQMLESDVQGRDLSIDLLLEWQRVLTKDDPEVLEADRGRLRKDEDEVKVVDDARGEIVYFAPPEIFMREELGRLVAFANEKRSSPFVHPVLRAVILHFWLAYLHPFIDGNGRTARALFYWSMLRAGYSSILYFPISTVIRRSRDQYNNAYLWSEQDDSDLTYFISYHLRQIHNSIHEFKKYIEDKEHEHEEVESQLHLGPEYNARQKLVLGHLIAEGEKGYVTVQSHSMTNGVSWLTAQKDLKRLVKSGYLETQKISRYVRYMPTQKLLSAR